MTATQSREENSNDGLRQLEERIETLLEERRAAVSADAATALLYDYAARVFDLPVQVGLLDVATFTDRSLMPGTDRFAGRVVRELQSLFISDVHGHPFVDGPFVRREGIRSTAARKLPSPGSCRGLKVA